MAKTIKITDDGLKKLQEELETLKTEGRADIAEKINYLIDNPSEYNNLKSATLNLRKTDTLDMFYKVINECPKADYTKINFSDNKKQVIKNVDKQRRLSIKKNKNS